MSLRKGASLSGRNNNEFKIIFVWFKYSAWIQNQNMGLKPRSSDATSSVCPEI